jgi:TIR domain
VKHAAGSIFISYRREDTQGEAGHLLADLRRRFGDERVFFDVATIRPGEDFRKAVEKAVGSCAVLVVVIGKKWLTAADASGRRRLDDPRDFVRFETAVALRRDVRVIPVLVQGAAMPNEEELPDDLKDLVWRNAQELSHGRWEYDASRLVKAIELAIRAVEVGEEKTGEAPPRREPEPRTAAEPEQAKRPDPAPRARPSFVRKPVAIAVAAVVLAVGAFGVSTMTETVQPTRSEPHASVPGSTPVVDHVGAGNAAAPSAKDAVTEARNAPAIASLIYPSAPNTNYQQPTRPKLFQSATPVANGEGGKRNEDVCKDKPTEHERIKCELEEQSRRQQELSRDLQEMDEKAKAAIRHVKAG